MLHVTHLLGRIVSRLCDDEEFNAFDCDGSDWFLPARYIQPHLVGCGTFGQVCSVLDSFTNDRVVIKKLYKAFDTGTHARRTHRELILLHHMNHENVVGLLDAFTPDCCAQSLTDIYLVTAYMSRTLHCVIGSEPNLSMDKINLLVYQILRGLKYIHSVGVIHRDLKPSNIVVDSEYRLKIIDFGLARVASNSMMTGYVATRWYRAPEVMFNWEKYGNSGKLDVWSVGCIMAQMLTGKPLFPGQNCLDQIRLIIDFLGTPSDHFLVTVEEAAREFLLSLPPAQKTNFINYFHRANTDALDLLDKMLQLNMRDRISASEALKHSYFSLRHDNQPEELLPAVRPFHDPLEEQSLSVEEFKCLVFAQLKEISRWKSKNPSIPCCQGNLQMPELDCM
ncbi:uncharacterized protein LOC134185777 isoform X2 [Corticium candelabrum]|uniref:uncharacterized protein LOC134185777 isoform X2 n=1 Tax=Corticium candelabrum TaxID=121492 RepID=UPI002E255DF5|nr:uncharacterized protein LOC134185777 isoform X2 [Corticium candelabrum]